MPGLLPRVRLRKSIIVFCKYSRCCPASLAVLPSPWKWWRWQPGQPTEAAALCALAATSFGASGCCRLGHFSFEKYLGEREQVLPRQRGSDRRHQLILARAALEVAQLKKEIPLVLAPDHRRRLELRHARLAVAGGADLCLLLDVLSGKTARAHKQNRPKENSAPDAGGAGKLQHRLELQLFGAFYHGKDGALRAPSFNSYARLSLPLRASEAISPIVKAMMLLPRLKSIWVFPPAPTTMYCLPSTE